MYTVEFQTQPLRMCSAECQQLQCSRVHCMFSTLAKISYSMRTGYVLWKIYCLEDLSLSEPHINFIITTSHVQGIITYCMYAQLSHVFGCVMISLYRFKLLVVWGLTYS